MKNENISKINLALQNQFLSPYATKDEDVIRFFIEEEDIRPPFFHDIDRIIYSMSYTRYMDKTQVFSFTENDHISKRMIHVQLVSKIARTIGRALKLNGDLIEASALGHDLGHVPFGHVGESILNEISLFVGEGYFNHNVQSVRMLMYIENQGLGKNLSLQVMDAIMCHNGELLSQKYTPITKTKDKFLEEYNQTYHDKAIVKKLVPMTLEGCIVRISDMIAYLGRDIDDAILLNVFDRAKLPKEIVDVLGEDNRNIINKIIVDVIEHSIDCNCISMSDKVFKAMLALKEFNMEHIYMEANHQNDLDNYKKMFQCVFFECKEEIRLCNKRSLIYRDFLNYKNEMYHSSTTDNRKVLDFISGMTDGYFLKVYSYYKN